MEIYFQLIKDAETLREACEQLKTEDYLGFDTETTELDPYEGNIRLVQLSNGRDTKVIDLKYFAEKGDLKTLPDLAPLRELLSAPKPIKIAHNAKFDAKWVGHHLGTDIGGIFDTLLASQLIAAGDQDRRHNLAEVANFFLGIEVDKSEQVSDWNAPELTDSQIQYAAKDAAIMVGLREKVVERLKQDGLVKVAKLEFDCVMPIARMELNGFYLDEARWREQLEKVKKEQTVVALELQQMLSAGVAQASLFGIAEINLDSQAQVTDALKNLGVPVPETTRGWQLQPLAVEYPVVAKLLEYRGVAKAISSFGETILSYIKPDTGRIHADFRQIGAPTGRFSCLTGDTLVSTDQGLKRIDKICSGDLVKTTYGYKTVLKAWSNGLRPTFKVTLEDGRIIRATSEHRFLTGKGNDWKRLDDLEVGDNLFVSVKTFKEKHKKKIPLTFDESDFRARKDVEIPNELSIELCELLGLAFADGFLGKRHIRPNKKRRWSSSAAEYDRLYLAFNGQDEDLIENIIEKSEKLFGENFKEVKCRTCRLFQLASTKLAQFFSQFGLTNSALTKEVSEVILNAPTIFQAAFLRGLFEGDGHRFEKQSHRIIGLTGVNHKLLLHVQNMLSNLGIYSTVKEKNDTSGFAGNVRYVLTITKKSGIKKFMSVVGFLSKRKNEPFHISRQITDGIATPFRIKGSELYREAVALGKTPASRIGVKPFIPLYKNSYIKAETVFKLTDKFGILPSLQPVLDYIDLDIRQVKIKSIEPAETEDVYDLTIEDVHQFIANGIIVHNCNNPNLQQIPHEQAYRRCFRAPEGKKLVIADYCIAKGTRIATERGLIPIEKMQITDRVCLEDGTATDISAIIRRGKLPVVKLNLKHGFSLTATELHRIRVIDKSGNYVWRRIGELQKTDFVVIQTGRGISRRNDYEILPKIEFNHSNNVSFQPPKFADEDFALFFGYVCGDGSYSKRSIKWVVNQQDSDIEQRIGNLALNLFGLEVHRRPPYRGVFEAMINSTPLVSWCKELKIGKECVPDFIWSSKKSVVAAFLRGLFEADGSVTDNDTGKVSFASVRENLAREVHQLLVALGISATLRHQKKTGPGKKFSCWMINVTSSGLPTFADSIGFLSIRKRKKLEFLIARQTGKTIVGNMPNLADKIRVLNLKGESRRLLNNTSSLKRPVSLVLAQTIEKDYPKVADSLKLKHLTQYKQLFLPVVSIENIGEEEVFDLSVPETMTYISDGFVSHNSQVELRILADFSNDENFIKAFQTGADFHTITAAQVFNVKPDDVTSDQRSFAKRLNFGVVYGIGSQRFALMTGLTQTEAENIMRRYFGTYRGLDSYLRDSARKVLSERISRTASGRLYRFRFDENDRRAVSGAQRNGKNFPIQGTSADILKRALHLLHEKISGTSAKLVNIVHDEVILECDAGEAETAAKNLEDAMCAAGEEYITKVPVKVDVHIADEWTK